MPGKKLQQNSISKRTKAVSSDHDLQIIQNLKTWFTKSQDLTKTINKFAEKHAYDYDPHDEEYILQHTSLHDKFKKLIEDKVNEYLASETIKQEQFTQAARRFMLNHENGECAVFIKILMATADFDVFIELLRIARYELDRKHEEENYKRRDSEILSNAAANKNNNGKKHNNITDSPSKTRRKKGSPSPNRRRRSPSKGNVPSSLHSTI